MLVGVLECDDRFAVGTSDLHWHAMSLDELLADVHAAPGDDLPRLAYADAVESQDSARAELTRVQPRGGERLMTK